MPNWCNNSITIRHSDPAMIQRVINSKGLLMEFFPTPQDLLDTVAGFPGEDQREAHEAQMKRNLEKYGYKDWYDWNVANWGTKWDVDLEDPELLDPNTVSAWFDSAWAPPVNAYEKLIELASTSRPTTMNVVWASVVCGKVIWRTALMTTTVNTVERLQRLFGKPLVLNWTTSLVSARPWLNTNQRTLRNKMVDSTLRGAIIRL